MTITIGQNGCINPERLRGFISCFSKDSHVFMRTLFGNDETIYQVFTAINSNRYENVYIEMEVCDEDKNRGVKTRGYKFKYNEHFFAKWVRTIYIDGSSDEFMDSPFVNTNRDISDYLITIAEIILQEREHFSSVN